MVLALFVDEVLGLRERGVIPFRLGDRLSLRDRDSLTVASDCGVHGRIRLGPSLSDNTVITSRSWKLLMKGIKN